MRSGAGHCDKEEEERAGVSVGVGGGGGCSYRSFGGWGQGFFWSNLSLKSDKKKF